MIKEGFVDILVVRKDKLFANGDFEGFKTLSEQDLLPTISANCEYQQRTPALEKDATFKQIIPYIIVVNPKEHKVFGYKRFKKHPGLHETRLHNKFSIGLGGHIDKTGIDDTTDNLIMDCMLREFREEVAMENYPVPKIVGFINSEATEVDRMHFAIAAIAETKEGIGKRENEEVVEEKFYSVDEIDLIMKDANIQMDTWTRVVWPYVRQYLLN